ncbi:hypothetical protein GJ496_003941 [Pomphorhynchus laevis]|nr:hypothetical protein GJ496_003941 [Pomphorhynchus laevis]
MVQSVGRWHWDRAIFDMEHFILGTAEEQVLRAIATSCTVSVSVSTILHRWSMSSNIIQSHYNRTGHIAFGATIQFLDRGLIDSVGSLSCTLMSSACNLIGDFCSIHLPSAVFSIVLWSDLLSDEVHPIANNSGWLAGWPRKGFMARPVVLTIDNEICSISLNYESPICIIKGDDVLLAATKNGKCYPSSGYNTVVNVISQHCVVDNKNRLECFVIGRDGTNSPALIADDIIPAFEYNDNSLLFTVNIIWHYCWRQLLTIGVQWTRSRLTRVVQQLFSRR